MKYSQYSDAGPLASTDLIALSRAPHEPTVGGNNTFQTTTPDGIRDYVNENAQLEGIDQVTGLDTALGTKVNKAGDTMTGALTLPGDPISALQAATKQYVDNLTSLLIAGLSAKGTCRVATTTELTANYDNGSSEPFEAATLTSSANAVLPSIDGVTLALDDRVLVKDQSTAAHNGIYVVTDVGSVSTDWVLTRATDYDGSPNGEVAYGTYTIVTAGTANTGKVFMMTNADFDEIGTHAIDFTPWTLVVAGNGLALAGATLNVNVSGADKLLGRVTSGAGNVEEIACTAAGRALIDDVDASDQRATLGVPGLAVDNAFTAITDSFSATTGALTTAGGMGIAKKLHIGTGLYLPSGGNPSELNYYEEYSSSGNTYTGPGTTGTSEFRVVRVGRAVILFFNGATCTSSSEQPFTATIAVPSRFHIFASMYFPVNVQTAAGTYEIGSMQITSAGQIKIWRGAGGVGNFPATGTVGFLPGSVSWFKA